MRARITTATLVLVFAALSTSLPAAEPANGWLGAALEPVRPRAGAVETTPSSGVVVMMIVEGSPAEKAGLRGRDVIVGIDGLDVSSPAELIDRIKKLPPDSWVGLRLLRRGAERQLNVRLGTRPADSGSARFVRGWLGIRAMEIPPKLRVHFGAPENAGVMVSELVEGGPAEAGGLDLGDVIHAVDGEPVPSAAALYELIARSGVGNEVELSIGREGNPLVLTPIVERAPDRTPR